MTPQPTDWFRIDASNGSITSCSDDYAQRRAYDNFDHPAEVLASGRFRTAFAYYSQAQYLTEAEQAQVLSSI